MRQQREPSCSVGAHSRFCKRLYEETAHLLEAKTGQHPLPNKLPATYRQVLVVTRCACWLLSNCTLGCCRRS